MNLRQKFTISFILFLLFVPGSLAFGKDLGWEFDERAEIADWSAEGGVVTMKDGKLVISGGRKPRVNSAIKTGIPLSHRMVSVSVKSSKDASMTLRFLSAASWQTYDRTFKVLGGDRYLSYSFHLAEVLPPQERIRAVALNFNQDDIDIALDFVRFSKPTLSQEAAFLWKGFWKVGWINFKTVNYAKNPAAGPVTLTLLEYILIAAVFLAIALFSVFMKRRLTRDLIVKAMAFSFLVAALMHAVRMDYGWLKTWRNEVNFLSGREVDDRITRMYAGMGREDLFALIGLIKKTVPDGSSVRPLRLYDEQYVLLGRYYLLPVLTSQKADYLWTLNDKEVTFSASRRTLMLGKKIVASPVELVARHNDHTALYKVLGGTKR